MTPTPIPADVLAFLEQNFDAFLLITRESFPNGDADNYIVVASESASLSEQAGLVRYAAVNLDQRLLNDTDTP